MPRQVKQPRRTYDMKPQALEEMERLPRMDRSRFVNDAILAYAEVCRSAFNSCQTKEVNRSPSMTLMSVVCTRGHTLWTGPAVRSRGAMRNRDCSCGATLRVQRAVAHLSPTRESLDR